MMIKELVKRAFGAVGLKVEKRDRLAESIPANYLRSDYLPSIYRQSVQRLFYFKDMQDRVALPGYTGKIALLHLDCDLYKSYITALELLFDKVVPGGVILFDEYEEEGKFPGARKAIDEFLSRKSEAVERFSGYRYEKYFAVKQ